MANEPRREDDRYVGIILLMLSASRVVKAI